MPNRNAPKYGPRSRTGSRRADGATVMSARMRPKGCSAAMPAVPAALNSRAARRLHRSATPRCGICTQCAASAAASRPARHSLPARGSCGAGWSSSRRWPGSLGAENLDRPILRRRAGVPLHPLLAVIEIGVEHALQRADRAGRDAAEEHLAERQPIERPVLIRAPAPSRGNCRSGSACGAPARTRP